MYHIDKKIIDIFSVYGINFDFDNFINSSVGNHIVASVYGTNDSQLKAIYRDNKFAFHFSVKSNNYFAYIVYIKNKIDLFVNKNNIVFHSLINDNNDFNDVFKDSSKYEFKSINDFDKLVKDLIERYKDQIANNIFFNVSDFIPKTMLLNGRNKFQTGNGQIFFHKRFNYDNGFVSYYTTEKCKYLAHVKYNDNYYIVCCDVTKASPRGISIFVYYDNLDDIDFCKVNFGEKIYSFESDEEVSDLCSDSKFESIMKKVENILIFS